MNLFLKINKRPIVVLFSLILFFCHNVIFAQNNTAVTIADLTLKIGMLKTERFYYRFAEGDKIIFNCTVKEGESIKQIQIYEYPSRVCYSEIQSKGVNKFIYSIPVESIYEFKFTNGLLSKVILNVKIERIASANSPKNFNTTVDTKLELGKDYEIVKEKYLIKKDTTFELVTDQLAKVHSKYNPDGCKTVLDFTLPDNCSYWTYWIGVGQEGKKNYEAANKKLFNIASKLSSLIPGYGPLVSVAINGASYLSVQDKTGENVQYWFITDYKNSRLFFEEDKKFNYFKSGNIVTDFGKINKPKDGRIYLALRNDNLVEAIDVNIKVIAVKINEKWGIREVKKVKEKK